MLSLHQLSIDNFDATLRMADELAHELAHELARKHKKRVKTAPKRTGSSISAQSEESGYSRCGSRSVGSGGTGREGRAAAGGNSSKSKKSAAAAGGITNKNITARPKLRDIHSTKAAFSPALWSVALPTTSMVPRKGKTSNKNDDGTTCGIVAMVGNASCSAATGMTSTSTTTTKTTIMAAPAPPAFLHTMIVYRTWQQIKNGTIVPKYEECLGEQIILRMIELDPTARTKMSLTYLRSSPTTSRFSQLSQILVDLVELMVALVGPDSDLEEYQDEFKCIQKHCTAEGIQVTLLSASISHAVQQVLLMEQQGNSDESMNTAAHSQEECTMAWKKVIDFVAFKVQQEQPENF